MNQIITRSILENNVSHLAEFPRELMYESEAEIVDFILKFNREYGKAPSRKRVMEKFDSFLPYIFESSTWEEDPPPIGDVFQQSLERKLLSISSRKLREAETVMNRDGVVPLELLSEIEKIHTMSLGVTRYSAFDRELYFRRRALDIPFKLINRHIGGLSNGDYMLVIGRLGTGKSTIAQYVAKTLWEAGKRILFVSAEMLSLDVFSRIDAMVGKFNPLELRKGKTKLMADVLTGVEKTVEKEKAGEIIVPRSRLISPQQIASFAKNLDVDLIIVDGAYLLRPSTGKFSSKWEKVATVSNELKQISLDLDLPMIATAQIKRGADGSGDGYTPEDIAFSDALGQDSDFVLAVHPNATMKSRAELQLIKNRYGSLCTTQINIDFDTMTITDETIDGAVDAEEKEDWTKWARTVKKDRGIE